MKMLIDRRRQFAWLFLTWTVAGCGCMLLSACNAVSGAGEDLQRASEEVQEEIN